MKKEDLNNLGLGEDRTYTRVDPEAGKREAQGFVAGTGVRASNKWKIFWAHGHTSSLVEDNYL